MQTRVVSPTCAFTIYPYPPGTETRKVLCFDTGELVAEVRLAPRATADGGTELVPEKTAPPAIHGRKLLESADAQILRVLDRHAGGESDTNVRVVGRIISSVAQYTGPSPLVRRMARLYLYVAMQPEFYDKVRAAGKFSYRSTLEDDILPVEISPTPGPHFLTTRIVPATFEEATRTNAHFFSQNPVRAGAPEQSARSIMTEGTPESPAAPAAAAATTPATAEPARASPAASLTDYARQTAPSLTYSDLVASQATREAEIGTLTHNYEAAKTEIAALKADNAALQAANADLRAFAADRIEQNTNKAALDPDAAKQYAAAYAAVTTGAPAHDAVCEKFKELMTLSKLAAAQTVAAAAGLRTLRAAAAYSQHLETPARAAGEAKRPRFDESGYSLIE